jgi:hypothetical protein
MDWGSVILDVLAEAGRAVCPLPRARLVARATPGGTPRPSLLAAASVTEMLCVYKAPGDLELPQMMGQQTEEVLVSGSTVMGRVGDPRPVEGMRAGCWRWILSIRLTGSFASKPRSFFLPASQHTERDAVTRAENVTCESGPNILGIVSIY